MTLTTRDLVRLEVATRTLLSPLAATDPGTWRGEAARSVRELLGADHAVFGLPAPLAPYVLDGIDEATWAPYADHVANAYGE